MVFEVEKDRVVFQFKNVACRAEWGRRFRLPTTAP
jgi:hypothetical protein